MNDHLRVLTFNPLREQNMIFVAPIGFESQKLCAFNFSNQYQMSSVTILLHNIPF